MRRTIVIAMIAAVGGFCVASAPAFGTLRFNIWTENGPQFQLGYVVGYLDAIQLAQRKDIRSQIPTGGGKNFDRWVTDVNAFYAASTQNQNRPVPDAMYEVGSRIQAEMLKRLQDRAAERKAAMSPSPSPKP